MLVYKDFILYFKSLTFILLFIIMELYEVKQYIEDKKTQAMYDIKEIRKSWSSSYWCWVEQWIIDLCDELLQFIEDWYA